MLLDEDSSRLQVFLDRLRDGSDMFSISFAPSKCKVLLEHRIVSKPNLLPGEQLDAVDKCSCLDSYISPDDPISGEVYSRIRNTRLVFANLKRLCRQRDTLLSIKGRVYTAVVRSVLFSETWSLRTEDMRRISMFEHHYLRSVGRTR